MITDIKNWVRPQLKTDCNLKTKVGSLLASIEKEGDAAIDRMAIEFDQQLPKSIPLKPFDEYLLTPNVAKAIQISAARIEKFASFQKQQLRTSSFSDEYGTYGQNIIPIEKVGAYIPGGCYPLISTALMTLIPARIAGSPIRVACSPSDHPAILAAASLAGATQFLKIGGVQAIGALANGYGNSSFPAIPAVDIIVGPGNAWVNEAKSQVQNRVAIDGIAGPSELLAICDGAQPIEWLALDALAQAEHDLLACSLIVSDDADWLISLLEFLESKKETKDLMKRNQVELIFADSTKQLVSFCNQYAPEHLMLCHKKIDPKNLINYGSLFVGANSAVALGDYITGPNHTLPTLANARQNGGLNVNTFLRTLTVQTINDVGRNILSGIAMSIAKEEGLKYHCQSLAVRL